MKHARYLTAREAAQELSISLPTLYAYVSRGLIRSEAAGGSKRDRRYRVEDVQKLKERREQRRDPGKAVERALHWGAPIMDSALTLIAEGRVYYRGRDALELATQCTVEQVAALIWTGNLDEAAGLFNAPVGARSPRFQSARRDLADLPTMEAFQTLLPLAAADDPAAYDLRPASVARTGARILKLMTTIAADGEPQEAGIAQALQRSWAPRDERVLRLIDAALVLCADHELNVSSFTARCVASAGSTPYAAVIAGLAALQGLKHGRHTERVEALMQEIGKPARARAAVAGRLRRGEAIPGFGHPLYPDGDPRGRALLQLTAEVFPRSPAVSLAKALAEAAGDLVGEHPTVDFGLATLARALNRPTGGALAIFALGRTVGWIGHAIEQYRLDQMIRPRARYVGPLP